MKNFLTDKRAAGLLVHITSLPSSFGIGDLGPSSIQFLDFLRDCGQSYWQMLPVGPTNPIFDNSPYMSTSAFAGSPLLISPDLLYQNGLVSRERLDNHPIFSIYTTDFATVIDYKKKLLKEAFSNFSPKKENEYEPFVQQTQWLDDYALYMTLKNKYSHSSWSTWPGEIASRDSKTLSLIQREEAETINYYRFEQFEFYRQWQALHNHARALGIRLFGDLPIYVGYDSADVWANQAIFTLNPTDFSPTFVAGVPPDYFSKTGQRWGNPLYRWNSKEKSIKKSLLDWWTQRFASVFTLFDVVRIDHFRGFESYWTIPAEEDTAIKGRWVKGPGKPFFVEIFKRLGKLDIIAEDLGDITPAVIKLKDSLCFPGMKILQFAFDGNPDNSFLPYNFESSNFVVYTGTHDNDTTLGWFLSDRLGNQERSRIKAYVNRDIHDSRGIHHDLIHLALSSTAALSIIPLQDILGFGSDCRMNTPSTNTGNWRWRCAPEFLTSEISTWLREQTELFGRTP